MRLYDLTEQYNTLAEMLEEDADNELLQTYLTGIDGAFDEKVESIVKLMKSKVGVYNAIDSEAKRLQARALKIGKEINWLENYVESQMITTGKDEVKSVLFDIKLGLCPQAVTVTNQSLIPQTYFTKPTAPPPALDKRKLLEDMKTGIVIAGAEMTQRKTLRIK